MGLRQPRLGVDDGGFELRPRQPPCPAQIGAAQVGAGEIGAAQICTMAVGAAEVGFAQAAAAQIGAVQIGAVKIGPAHLGVVQVGAVKVSAMQIGPFEIGPPKGRTMKVRPVKIRAFQNRTTKAGAVQVGAMKIRACARLPPGAQPDLMAFQSAGKHLRGQRLGGAGSFVYGASSNVQLPSVTRNFLHCPASSALVVGFFPSQPSHFSAQIPS